MRVAAPTYLGWTMAGCVVASVLLLAGQASVTVIWLGSVLFGLFMASVFPTAIAVAEAHFPVEVSSLFVVLLSHQLATRPLPP